MIKLVKAYRVGSDDILELPLQQTDGYSPSQYVVKAIDGLGPVEASLTTADSAVFDGGDILGSRVGMRNIVLTLGFNPDYAALKSVSNLRRDLYPRFMTKRRVELLFQSDDMEDVKIQGVVDKFDTLIFSKDPAVQISILCPDPKFSSLVETVVPFDVTQLSPGITVPYDGDVNTPFRLEMVLKPGWKNLALYSAHVDENTQEAVVDSITTLIDYVIDPTGVTLILDTERGSRGLTWSGSQMWLFQRAGFWMELQAPETPFIWDDSVDQYISVTMKYYKRYGGL